MSEEIVYWEVFDKDTSNMIGDFDDLDSAITAIREYRELNGPSTCYLSRVVNGWTVQYWADEVLALLEQAHESWKQLSPEERAEVGEPEDYDWAHPVETGR